MSTKPNKRYLVTIELNTQTVEVSAENEREAKKKAIARLKQRKFESQINHKHSYVQEKWY